MRLTYAVIMAIGRDAGNASMRAAGRTVWDTDDYSAAAAKTDELWPMLDASTHAPIQPGAAFATCAHGAKID